MFVRAQPGQKNVHLNKVWNVAKMRLVGKTELGEMTERHFFRSPGRTVGCRSVVSVIKLFWEEIPKFSISEKWE